jgi:hypothetical protein
MAIRISAGLYDISVPLKQGINSFPPDAVPADEITGCALYECAF